MVAVLRGHSPATELADVAHKLKDMTAYHRDSDGANAAFARRFQHIFGGWYGGGINQLFEPFWAGRTLYASNEVSYLDASTGSQRLQAFTSCLGGGGEICSFDGHGSPDGILF